MCAARATKAPKPVNVHTNGNGSEREKALELALAQIDKAFGRGACCLY